jgi:Ca2+/Na+ antiporter
LGKVSLLIIVVGLIFGPAARERAEKRERGKKFHWVVVKSSLALGVLVILIVLFPDAFPFGWQFRKLLSGDDKLPTIHLNSFLGHEIWNRVSAHPVLSALICSFLTLLTLCIFAIITDRERIAKYPAIVLLWGWIAFIVYWLVQLGGFKTIIRTL